MSSESQDKTVTIDEYLSSVREEEAIVLGGNAGEIACTFPRGYARQAVYACISCNDVTGEKAGICFECSIQCHKDHEVVELHTKRSFRCDCGNKKFKSLCKCILWEEKDDLNILNKYNHNFNGLFCICSRPHPDPDIQGSDEVFQCGICEDWFHLQHLNLPTEFTVAEDYEELTCHKCIVKYPILWAYYASIKMDESTLDESFDESEPKAKRTKIDNNENEIMCCKFSQILDQFNLQSMYDESKIRDIKVADFNFPSAIFWPESWRKSVLCDCISCQLEYKSLGIEFLMDPEDTISHYMEVGNKIATEMESECNSTISRVLSELPHSAAVNVATGISRLRTAIQDFLMRHQENGSVVTEEDVKSFCDDLKRDLL